MGCRRRATARAHGDAVAMGGGEGAAVGSWRASRWAAAGGRVVRGGGVGSSWWARQALRSE